MSKHFVCFDMLSIPLDNKSRGKIAGITKAQRNKLENLERAVIVGNGSCPQKRKMPPYIINNGVIKHAFKDV